MLGGLVLALPFVWLSEKGVHPLRAFARVLGSRGPVGGCVLAVLFVAGTIFGGYKARGPAAAPASTVARRVADAADASSLRVIDSRDPRLPAQDHVVTNDCFTAIVPTATSVLLRAEWPSPYFLSARYLEFLAKPDLVTSDWVRVGMARAAWDRTDLAVEVPRAALPFDASRAAFFSFGSGEDSDGDGMPDGWELAHGLDPEDPSDGGDADLDGDGIANRIEFLMDADPRSSGTGTGFAAPGVADPARAGAWEVSPAAFLFTLPGDTGTILERTFPVERLSAAERFFVTTDPSWISPYWTPLGFGLSYGVNGAAPTNRLEVALDAGMSVPLPEGPVSNVTVRLQAPPGGWVWMSTPLHLVRWSPRYVFEEDGDVRILADDGHAPVVAVRRNAETADFRVRARVDASALPSGVVVPREDLFAPPAPGLRVEVVDAEAGTVVLHADDPLWAELPPEGTNAPVSICCWEASSADPGVLDAGPRASAHADPWPLSSSPRRRAFRRARDLPSSAPSPSFVVRPSHPRITCSGAAARAVRAPRAAGAGAECACTNGACTACSQILLDGLPVGRACFCSPGPPDEPPDPEEPVTEETDECPCGNGADDAPESQHEHKSFHLRVPLGDSESEGLYGYVWTSLDGPAEITPAVFNVLGVAGVASTTNALGEFTVTCMRPGGKTVAVSRIEDGVSIAVTNASGRFEYRWEVWNESGRSDIVRVRRVTVSGNATADATYILRDGMGYGGEIPAGSRVQGMEPSERSVREDALRDVQTIRRKWVSPDDPDLVTDEFDETYLGWTQRVSAVMSEYAKLGAGSFACRRLTRRFGYDASGRIDESRTYWTDGRSRLRHGRLRSLRSNREPWRFCEYDALGRESVRLEQLDGSPFPESLAADGVAVSHLAELPEGCSARAAVTSYA
ncbi:MAG: thrombospondin type 3 repeat-containing protein, partial [Kiritimatiellae bacterium]|nr:thrombospondin type 3 repeat-containing protein [Kiritimatiellia bacterium]